MNGRINETGVLSLRGRRGRIQPSNFLLIFSVFFSLDSLTSLRHLCILPTFPSFPFPLPPSLPPSLPPPRTSKRYGKDFLADFAPVSQGAGQDKNGAFITSCICHGCPWNDSTLKELEIGIEGFEWFEWMSEIHELWRSCRCL